MQNYKLFIYFFLTRTYPLVILEKNMSKIIKEKNKEKKEGR